MLDKDEMRFFDHTVDEVSLNKGANLVAVEVHQNQAKSTDLSFDLEIAGITTPKAVTGAGIPAATFAEKFKAFGIPDVIQSEFWNFRTEQFFTSGDAARATEALQQAEAHDAGDKSDPRRLRLRALVAATGAKTEEAGRLYDAAMDAMVQQAAAGKTIYAAQLPAALREAGLVLGQTPADLACVFRRFASPTRTELELNLMLNWAKAKAGKDPGALAQIWFALSDGLKRHQDALTIAESVLASLPKPKAGAPAVEIRQ